MAAGKSVELSKDEIKRILQLPLDEEGDAKLEKMLAAFDDKTFSPREKLFILFFTSPMSKTCGKVNKSGQAVGGSWKSWGSWAYQQPHVQEKIKELNLEKYVIMTGNVSNVGEYMSAMDVFVFPSLYEGMPLAMVEAQTNGLPCCISDKIPKDIYLTVSYDIDLDKAFDGVELFHFSGVNLALKGHTRQTCI
jgi:hypothetical protein